MSSFKPVRAPRIEITTALLEEFIASLRRGEFVIRSIEIPQQGAPLKAEVNVFTSIRGAVNVSGSLTFEKFDVKEVEGQITLTLPDDDSVEETPKEKKKITSAEFWAKVDEAGPMRAVRMMELYEEYDIETEDEEAIDRREKAAATEKQAHPDWWTLVIDVADSNESNPRQRMVRLKMPPFDTFAFDGVSDVLRSTGRTLEDYKDGYCTLAVVAYQNIFPILSSKGYKLSPAP